MSKLADAHDLRRDAREIFADALSAADAGEAARRAIRLEGSRLTIARHVFDIQSRIKSIYAVAVGKAALPMATALDETIGGRLAGGVISAPSLDASLSARWQTFAGGHPLPNRASIDAARAAFELLQHANHPSALVVFLISGGGSAMLELPRDDAMTLDDLRAANRALVTCGASIAEINAVRRAVSAVKGGGLSLRAPLAAQATLIVSDTGAGDEANVASGPTFPPPAGEPDARAIVARYDLASKLPVSVLRAIERRAAREYRPARFTDEREQPDVRHETRKHTAGVRDDERRDDEPEGGETRRLHHVLLDNASVVEHAAKSAAARGFTVEVARDVVEQPIEEGCAMLVARLSKLRRSVTDATRGVCLVSGGEFACPVRGAGVGGRNAESVLRWALEIGAPDAALHEGTLPRIVALSAGTDGIDGNSPAAGAIADETTLARARRAGLDAREFLDASDAYTFFDALGDAVMTGTTGTNVRDLRILLMS